MRTLVIASCFVLLAASAMAVPQKTVEPILLDDTQIERLDFDIMGATSCVIGNLNPNRWAISNFIYGAESYAYLINPASYGCCPLGFVVDAVRMVVYFAAEDVPNTFDVVAGLAPDVWNGTCFVPGDDYCVSPVYRVNITNAGGYAITLPMGGSCACADANYPYFLTFHFVTAFPSTKRPGPVTDEFPVGCTSYNNYGAGWEDLTSVYGMPGELRIQADISCCESPVRVDEETWGSVKGLYR